MSKSKTLIENEQQSRSLLLFGWGGCRSPWSESSSFTMHRKEKRKKKKKKNYWEQNEVCRAIFLKAWTIDDALMSWGQSSDACEISQVITLIRIPPACITISWQINKDCKRAQLLFHMFSRQKVLLNDGKVATQIDKEETLSVVIKLAYVSLPFPVR